LVLLAGFAVACGANPVTLCEDDLAAAESCATEAGVEPGIDLEGFCELYSILGGDAKKAAVDALNCSIDAWDAADCSTPEGYADGAAASAACNPE
jgi:hypothetical protein